MSTEFVMQPNVPQFDLKADARAGWYDDRPEDGQVMQPVSH